MFMAYFMQYDGSICGGFACAPSRKLQFLLKAFLTSGSIGEAANLSGRWSPDPELVETLSALSRIVV